MAQVFVKRRDPAAPGSIPERLEMFPREVRFYREVAAEVGCACLAATARRQASVAAAAER